MTKQPEVNSEFLAAQNKKVEEDAEKLAEKMQDIDPDNMGFDGTEGVDDGHH